MRYEMDCQNCMNTVEKPEGRYCKPFLATGSFPFRLEGESEKDYVFRCPMEIRPTIPMIESFDREEIIENCTVQVWENSETGDVSVGWWENGKEKEE